MKTLYFDCFSGASGDMIVGALIDAGADFDAIRDALATLNVGGYSLAVEKVKKKGVMATKFHVNLDESHHHPHRHLRHIIEIIESGELPSAVKAASLETFRRIAECEAQVHGSTPEKIHFHEVGAVDSIVDIVGAHLALDQLAPQRVASSALHVGSGTVKAAHGIMPVPAPATALLLKRAPIYGGAVEGELVTPTGAALVTQVAQEFGPLPLMRVERIGIGSGARDLPDRANVLRVFLGEAAQESVTGHIERIGVMETDIDDMNPELLPNLIARLIDAGARDAFVTATLGKKGRPAQHLTVLVDEEKVATIATALFEHSTTFGVRMRIEERMCLHRAWKRAHTPWGDVRVKVGWRDQTAATASPEYEDCARVAESAGVPVLKVYQAAQAAAIRGELDDE